MRDFTNANSLMSAYKRVRKTSGWKESTQRYGLNLLRETYHLQKTLRERDYTQSECNTFKLCERGHLRLVKALVTRDMVMQHSLCDTVLVPELLKYIIHDNGASIKGKGISFTRRRFEQHLRWHYRRYGTEGYILKIDFRKYFDNIQHGILKKLIAEKIHNEDVQYVLNEIFKANEVDVSYTDDTDILQKVFSSLEQETIDTALLTGKRFMPKSLGIGSPVSQIAGIFFPYKIDNFCKTVKGIHCYDAYMDDRIVIHKSKEFLWSLLEEIKVLAEKQGITIHQDKTQIIKLSHGFTFLKTKYILTETGKIVKKIPRDVATVERRKLKKLATLVVSGDMSREKFITQYKSWKGDKQRYYNAYHTLKNMDKIFRRLLKWITQQEKLSDASSRKSSTLPES